MIGFAAFILITIAILFLPLSSKEYHRNNHSSDGTYKSFSSLKVVRHLFTTEITLPVLHGACDSIVFESTTERNVKVVSLTTPSKFDTCTKDVRYSEARHTFIMPIWENRLIVRAYDKQLFDIR